MTELDSSAPDPIPAPSAPSRLIPAKPIVSRVLTLAAIVVVGVYAQAQGRNLWREWVTLQEEVEESQRHAFVGYVDIAPNTECARPPAAWLRDEGDLSLLWAGWRKGIGHQWFRFPRGEIDRTRISQPGGELLSRPIDYPLVEGSGGPIWQRIPAQAFVVGHKFEGQACVYPLIIVQKVQVINDIIAGRPLLIVANRLAPEHKAISVFQADLDGRRLTMSLSNYYQDGKPLLFDRGTESLWMEEQSALRAIAGKLKNTSLPRLGSLVPVTWGSWLSQNKRGRLLVGADRSRGVPEE
jgi:hypothetical protein